MASTNIRDLQQHIDQLAQMTGKPAGSTLFDMLGIGRDTPAALVLGRLQEVINLVAPGAPKPVVDSLAQIQQTLQKDPALLQEYSAGLTQANEPGIPFTPLGQYPAWAREWAQGGAKTALDWTKTKLGMTGKVAETVADTTKTTATVADVTKTAAAAVDVAADTAMWAERVKKTEKTLEAVKLNAALLEKDAAAALREARHLEKVGDTAEAAKAFEKVRNLEKMANRSASLVGKLEGKLATALSHVDELAQTTSTGAGAAKTMTATTVKAADAVSDAGKVAATTAKTVDAAADASQALATTTTKAGGIFSKIGGFFSAAGNAITTKIPYAGTAVTGVCKLGATIGKSIPVVSGVISGGLTIYRTGAAIMEGNYSKATAEFTIGAAETAAGFIPAPGLCLAAQIGIREAAHHGLNAVGGPRIEPGLVTSVAQLAMGTTTAVPATPAAAPVAPAAAAPVQAPAAQQPAAVNGYQEPEKKEPKKTIMETALESGNIVSIIMAAIFTFFTNFTIRNEPSPTVAARHQHEGASQQSTGNAPAISQELAVALQPLDLNKDGKITGQELAQRDTNKDGRLSADELQISQNQLADLGKHLGIASGNNGLEIGGLSSKVAVIAQNQNEAEAPGRR